MERYTNKGPGNDDTAAGEHLTDKSAIVRLGQFEDLWEDLLQQQEDYSEQLENLRNQGKKDSVKFREMLSKKMINSHILARIQAYGIK